MSKKVFISYAHADASKRRVLVRALESGSPPIESVVIDARRAPGVPLAEKVIGGTTECDYFVPILTQFSISNQWVNQEIGYAIAVGKNIVPLVAQGIRGDLKGFVHDQMDLPFSFSGHPNQAREARAFRASCVALRSYLGSVASLRLLQSEISPQKVRLGDAYTTTVSFRGKVTNGFFDNFVANQGTGRGIWNWDRETLPDSGSRSPGILNGDVDVTRTYSWQTSPSDGWERGLYKVHVRLYSHLAPGVPDRVIVAETEHELEVF